MWDRLLATLHAIMDKHLARIDYLACYPARVVCQHSDGTFDVESENAHVVLPGHIPLRCGPPGAEADLPLGVRVMVAFESGDPRYPYISGWIGGAPSEVRFKAVAGYAGKEVARKDDATDTGTLSFTCAATVPPAPPGVILTVTHTPPGGAPQVQTVTLTGAVTGAPVGTAAALAGKVSAGAPGVKA